MPLDILTGTIYTYGRWGLRSRFLHPRREWSDISTCWVVREPQTACTFPQAVSTVLDSRTLVIQLVIFTDQMYSHGLREPYASFGVGDAVGAPVSSIKLRVCLVQFGSFRRGRMTKIVTGNETALHIRLRIYIPYIRRVHQCVYSKFF